MFNDYIWSIYLSGSGKNTVKIFEENLSENLSLDYIDSICDFHKKFCPSENINNSLKEELIDVYNDIAEGIYYFQEGKYTFDSAISYIFKLFMEENDNDPKEVFDIFSGSVAYFTTYFSIAIPNIFIPYYFTYNFNVFENIAKEFEIDIPIIPSKKDYKERFLYYGKICESLYDFRKKHNMSQYELCAFLYDFAPKYIGGIDSYIINDLPKSNSAYFIGASKDDSFLSTNSDIITPWQCNPETCVGDSIVMYLKSPISAIDSIWKSVSVGFIDPFFYYYRCTYIAKPVKIDRIPQKQLKEDEFIGKLPIVRKNMQGLNGVELPPSIYNRILDIYNIDLDRLEFFIGDQTTDIIKEKDVESKLIIPLLTELGYGESDYIRQLYIKIGNNNHTLIPDFVVNPIVSFGHQSADFLIEAKYSITNSKSLESAKMQARSYSKLLNAKYALIASKEGIRLTGIIDDYSKTIKKFSWQNLKREDNFHEIYKLLGKGKI